MALSFTRKKIIIAALIIILIIITFSPYGLVEQTSKPGFCNTCHVMRDHYEVWFLTGVHRSITCVDCHLPNNNKVNHLIWKGIDGTKDVVSFFSGMYSDYMTATGPSK